MSRKPFSLTEHQARQLVVAVEALDHEYPLDPADHRPYTGAFIRAVFTVTGKLYGPTIYRRLLKAYAPSRRPGTNSIALEKQLAEEWVRGISRNSEGQGGAAAEVGSASLDFDTAIGKALEKSLHRLLPRLVGQGRAEADKSEVDFLRTRLLDLQRRDDAAVAQVAVLNAQLVEARSVAENLKQELARATEQIGALTAANAKVSAEMAGQRMFAMQQIDAARGESRGMKERIAALELTCRDKDQMIDSLRMSRPGGRG